MFLQFKTRPIFAVAGSALIIRVLGLVSTFAFASITSFLLPTSDFGQIATLLSLVLFASTLGEFGQRDLAAREVSQHLALGNAIGAKESTANASFSAYWQDQVQDYRLLFCLGGLEALPS